MSFRSPRFLTTAQSLLGDKHDSHPRWLGYVLGLHILTWMVARGITDTNLDSYGDMLENFAWSQSLEWGSAKHPPLIAWITGGWFALFPTMDTAYHLLSYLNVSIGLLGVYRLAYAWRRPDLALPAVMLLCMAFPYSTLAAKFNANAILLGLWPWVAVAWLRSVQAPGRAALVWSVALGALSALAVLGKYYSGVLLLGLFLSALSAVEGRRWFATPKPWIALAVFVLCLAPHLAWLRDHDFVTLKYVGEQGGNNGLAWQHIVKFALAPLAHWFFPWLVCAWIYAPEEQSLKQRLLGWPGRLMRAWMPNGWFDSLFWMATLTWAITLLFGISGAVELSLPWAIPIGFGFSLLWLRNLSVVGAAAQHAKRRLFMCLMGWFALVVVASPWYAWHLAQTGADKYYLPRREAAAELLRTWSVRQPQALRWVGGQWAESALLAFYGDRHIRVVPGVPDQFPATVSSPFDWRAQAGLLVCPLGPVDRPDSTECPQQMKAWLATQGQNTEPLRLTVQSSGPRFALARPFSYLVFEYVPTGGPVPSLPD